MKHKCPICKAETDSAVHADFPFCSERCRERDLGNWASEKYVVSEPVFTEEDTGKARGTPSSFLWTTIWTTRMTPTIEATAAPDTPRKKPRLALAIATALGVGYIPKSPRTFGSLVGVATAYLSAVFFLRPTSF